MTKSVHQFIRKGLVYQSCKSDNSAYLGLLQPLPILEEVWMDISMDFIEGLPKKSFGKDVIFLMVDGYCLYFISLIGLNMYYFT